MPPFQPLGKSQAPQQAKKIFTAIEKKCDGIPSIFGTLAHCDIDGQTSEFLEEWKTSCG